MNDHTIFSLLVPVYNVENYLERCLNSIYDQIKTDCEVVLVDDGSTDNSGTICDKYLSRYPHLTHVYHKQNQGAYPTRNFAMDCAHGQYLWFIDPDDYIHPDAISNIRKSIETQQNPDVISAGYCKCNDNWIGEVVNANKEPQSISGEEYLTRGSFNAYLWANIYRRDFLLENHIRFNDQLNTQGDWLFNAQVYADAKTIYLADYQVYFYFQGNPNSTLNRSDKKHLLRGIENSMEAQINLLEFLMQRRTTPVYQPLRRWLSFTSAGLFYSLFHSHHSVDIIKNVLAVYQEKGLYPIGWSNNKRANVFAIFANCKWLFLATCAIRNYLFKRNNKMKW